MSDFERPVKPYVAPNFPEADVTRAARAHALAERSDPFAFGRAVRHMRRGLALPSEVLSDAANRTNLSRLDDV